MNVAVIDARAPPTSATIRRASAPPAAAPPPPTPEVYRLVSFDKRSRVAFRFRIRQARFAEVDADALVAGRQYFYIASAKR